MGVIYTLAINNFNSLSEKSSKLSLENLKEYLISLKYEKSAQLLCLDNCQECELYLDGNKSRELENFIDAPVTLYRYDHAYGYIEAPKEHIFDKDGIEKNVCFSYSVDNNGIGDQVLIEYKNKFYDMSEYFEPTKKFDTIEDARANREEIENKVLR